MADEKGSKAPAVPLLSYAAPERGGMVRLTTFSSDAEAEMRAAELRSAGIPAQVFNKNLNSLGMLYSGLWPVELHVPSSDVERANTVLALDTRDDLEPIEQDDSAPVTDDEGNPLTLSTAAAFESVGLLRDAQTVLAAGHVRSYLPAMALRGDRPPGEGKRFILRVADEDLERARRLLSETDERDDDDEEECRCPKCHAWRVIAVPQGWKSIAALLTFRTLPPERMECLGCTYQGPRREFLQGGAS
jgi:hypothetical protein